MSVPAPTPTTAAAALLAKYGYKEPFINAFQMARGEGLQLMFVPMTGRLADTAGFLDPASKAIYVNEADPPTRQLFTVAHELGHFVLRHIPEQLTVLTRSAAFDGAHHLIERDANTFAAALLMPEDMVREAMRQYGLGDRQPNTLAALFGVSGEAMRYRLRNLEVA